MYTAQCLESWLSVPGSFYSVEGTRFHILPCTSSVLCTRVSSVQSNNACELHPAHRPGWTLILVLTGWISVDTRPGEKRGGPVTVSSTRYTDSVSTKKNSLQVYLFVLRTQPIGTGLCWSILYQDSWFAYPYSVVLVAQDINPPVWLSYLHPFPRSSLFPRGETRQ